ncbi:hypothetical protein [Zobellella endophytica]|uniref:hypothetical protein n=1 Tax=Zobellella endophytica TaxID=2116700 RepID=UPI0011B22A86|nr:hypothetical protein [Zobellella endophytica]
MAVNPELSPLRHNQQGDSEDALIQEQLHHFGIDPASPFGQHLAGAALNLYRTNQDIHALWRLTRESLDSLLSDSTSTAACTSCCRTTTPGRRNSASGWNGSTTVRPGTSAWPSTGRWRSTGRRWPPAPGCASIWSPPATPTA